MCHKRQFYSGKGLFIKILILFNSSHRTFLELKRYILPNPEIKFLNITITQNLFCNLKKCNFNFSDFLANSTKYQN